MEGSFHGNPRGLVAFTITLFSYLFSCTADRLIQLVGSNKGAKKKYARIVIHVIKVAFICSTLCFAVGYSNK